MAMDTTAAPAAASPAPRRRANATAPAAAGGAGGAANPTIRPKDNIVDKRIKAFYESPDAAAKAVPQLRELSRLIAASPNVTRVMKNKDLVTTIFAPNNAVSAVAAGLCAGSTAAVCK
jgi:hypothetical protein